MLSPKAHRDTVPPTETTIPKSQSGALLGSPSSPFLLLTSWHLSTKKPPELVLTLLIPWNLWGPHPHARPSTRWIELIHIWNHFILSDLNRDSSSCQNTSSPVRFNPHLLKDSHNFVEIDNGHGFLIRKNVCRQQQRYSSFQVTQGPSSLIPFSTNLYFRKPESLEEEDGLFLWCFNSFD